MPSLSRRQLIAAGLAAGAAGAGRLALGAGGPQTLVLSPGPTQFALTGSAPTAAMMSYAAGAMPPLLRLKQGRPARIRVDNRLDEITTVHWHGLRLPFAQDGVPWLTQLPIGAGESFTYEFTPPDAGTFWYHPHCNTLEQIARGLAGILVVDEAEAPDFDADIALQIRDFRLGADGQFIAFSKPRNMARGGTPGTVSTVNWAVDPLVTAPAGGLARLRLAVTDVTSVYGLTLDGAEAALIALDGQPLPAPEPLAGVLLLAPGQRADLAVLMPAAGQTASLSMRLANGETRRLARLAAAGAQRGRSLAGLRPLPPNPTPAPDLAAAETVDLVFGWSPEGKAPGTAGLCGDAGWRFWSINRQAYPGDAPPDPAGAGAPLATLARGRSYVLRLRNETQNDHPVHLHGLAMHLLTPQGRLSGRVRDTVLLRRHEEALVAVLADNPGDWVLHCHVIEHQKSGLAGLIRVA